ncbi:MAG: hypothetical protein GWP14_06615 [Actinobacteria bacterium]|nr:hypothetical protein [Actinomycetota bacterium]
MDYTRFLSKLVLPLVCLLLVFAWGCRNKPSMSPEGAIAEERIPPAEKLISAPTSRLADVPVPLGAYFKADSSSSYQTGDQRTVNYLYGIWAKPALLRTFYQDNMPIHAWQLIHTVSNPRAEALSFRKAGESCVITIGPRNWLLQTLIRIEIQPVDVFRSTTMQGKN